MAEPAGRLCSHGNSPSPRFKARVSGFDDKWSEGGEAAGRSPVNFCRAAADGVKMVGADEQIRINSLKLISGDVISVRRHAEVVREFL